MMEATMLRGMRLRSLIILALALFLALSAPVWADERSEGAVVGGEFVLEPGDTYADDLVILGGSAHLKAESVVDGDVAVLAGQIVIEGRVMGDVVSFGGATRLGATARVDGDVIALGSLERDPRARVGGHVVEGADARRNREWLAELAEALPALGLEPPSQESAPAPAREGVPAGLARSARRVGTVITLLFVALIVMSLLPTHMRRITTWMSRSVVMSTAVGLLTLLISAVLVPVLVIICIGFPVAVMLVIGLLLGALVGWVAAGWLIAQKLRAWLKVREQTPMVEAVVGTLLITAVAMVPCVGPLLAVITVSWALGGVVLTRFGTVTGSGSPEASGRAEAAGGSGSQGEVDEATLPGETRRLADLTESGLGEALPDEQ
ncbi:MAG: polymer-forming cytoskeletal protein [Anaerolineae bacterium]|nr:polymer-forming cytoskeletal protein [Anaerolineae bacterium]